MQNAAPYMKNSCHLKFGSYKSLYADDKIIDYQQLFDLKTTFFFK